MTTTIDVEAARRLLLGLVHAKLQTARGMCIEGEAEEAIDNKIAEADDLVHKAAVMLGHERRADVPVEVVHGTVSMRPPLLFSAVNGDGVLLEDLLEQLLTELEEKQAKEPSRETALVITSLEQGLLWQ